MSPSPDSGEPDADRSVRGAPDSAPEDADGRDEAGVRGADDGSDRLLPGSVGSRPTAWRRRRSAARASESDTPAFAAYVARTEAYLDLFALLTIWLTVLPLAPSLRGDAGWGWTIGRIALSLVFGVDLVVRAGLSGHGWRYVSHHPVLSLAVIVPPVRILFSLRLLRSMFARGNLGQFLVVGTLLMLNGAIVVYAFESGAEGSDIETIGEALWWTVVTVATVGYGDYAPVTVGGRLTATLLMILAIVVAAVVTAQLASDFRDQAARSARDREDPDPGSGPTSGRAGSVGASAPTGGGTASSDIEQRPSGLEVEPVTAAQYEELRERLERIEALLRAQQGPGGSGRP